MRQKGEVDRTAAAPEVPTDRSELDHLALQLALLLASTVRGREHAPMLARFRHAYQPLLSSDWSSSAPTSSPTSTWLSPQRFTAKRKPVLALVATLVLAALLLATNRDPAAGVTAAVSSLTGGTRNNVVQATLAQVEQDGFPLAPNQCPQPRTTTYRLRTENLRFAPTQDWISPSPALPRSATLNDRLEAWLAAPVGTSTTWTAFNSLTCGNPSVRREQNQLHFRNNLEFWNGIDDDRVRAIRQELVGVLRTEERNGRFDEAASSGPPKRGIVWTAGNAVSGRFGGAVSREYSPANQT